MRLAIVGLVAAVMLALPAAAPGRQVVDSSEVDHGWCLLTTDPQYGHPIPWPGPPCIIDLSPSVEPLQEGGGFQMAPVPRRAVAHCDPNLIGVEQRNCEPHSIPSSNAGSSGSADGEVISDPLRWPQWFVPEP